QPRAQDQKGRVHLPSHHRGVDENPRADDSAHDDHSRVERAEPAREGWFFLARVQFLTPANCKAICNPTCPLEPNYFCMQFEYRAEAGRFLAEALQAYRGRKDVIVLALPRGGVPVGYEVARSLGAPLDVFVVRKLGVPGYSELAMGAIASGGIRVLNHDVVHGMGIPEQAIEAVAAAEERELARREQL